jgi:hypothetical protein
MIFALTRDGVTYTGEIPGRDFFLIPYGFDPEFYILNKYCKSYSARSGGPQIFPWPKLAPDPSPGVE